MGIFDFLKKDKAEASGSVTPPSTVLRNAGIDPAGLDFKFSGTGDVSISGTAASEDQRKRIVELISAIPQVQSVDDQMQIATATTATAEAAAVGDTAPAAETSHSDEGQATSEAKTHTVVRGDTLWKIAEHYYGKGNDYMKIFEANRDQLDDPDKIQVGQVLQIPPQ